MANRPSQISQEPSQINQPEISCNLLHIFDADFQTLVRFSRSIRDTLGPALNFCVAVRLPATPDHVCEFQNAIFCSKTDAWYKFAGQPPARSGDVRNFVSLFFFLFSALVTGPSRPWSLKLSDIRVYYPQTRARFGTTAHICQVVAASTTRRFPCRDFVALDSSPHGSQPRDVREVTTGINGAFLVMVLTKLKFILQNGIDKNKSGSSAHDDALQSVNEGFSIYQEPRERLR